MFKEYHLPQFTLAVKDLAPYKLHISWKSQVITE